MTVPSTANRFFGAQYPATVEHSALFSITTKSLTIEPHELILPMRNVYRALLLLDFGG
jgi:hypothetical protein